LRILVLVSGRRLDPACQDSHPHAAQRGCLAPRCQTPSNGRRRRLFANSAELTSEVTSSFSLRPTNCCTPPNWMLGRFAFHPSFYSSSNPMFANSMSWDEKSVLISRVGEQQKTESSLPGLTSLRRSTRTFGTSCQTPTNGQRRWPFANSGRTDERSCQFAFATITSRHEVHKEEETSE